MIVAFQPDFSRKKLRGASQSAGLLFINTREQQLVKVLYQTLTSTVRMWLILMLRQLQNLSQQHQPSHGAGKDELESFFSTNNQL